MVVHPEWLTPSDVTVPQAVDMEALLACLAPVHNRLPPDTPRNRESICNPGLPVPPLPSPPTDGLPFPGSGNRVAYDVRKSRYHGDDLAGGTVP